MKTLVLGIGNVLYGDEGAGVYVARRLAERDDLPSDVFVVGGGTGSLALLEVMDGMDRIVFVDATVDGNASGAVRRIAPRFAADFPPCLSAHDIGLRDLVEAWQLTEKRAELVLYTISIAPLGDLTMEMVPEVSAAVPEAAEQILRELSSDVASS